MKTTHPLRWAGFSLNIGAIMGLFILFGYMSMVFISATESVMNALTFTSWLNLLHFALYILSLVSTGALYAWWGGRLVHKHTDTSDTFSRLLVITLFGALISTSLTGRHLAMIGFPDGMIEIFKVVGFTFVFFTFFLLPSWVVFVIADYVQLRIWARFMLVATLMVTGYLIIPAGAWILSALSYSLFPLNAVSQWDATKNLVVWSMYLSNVGTVVWLLTAHRHQAANLPWDWAEESVFLRSPFH